MDNLNESENHFNVIEIYINEKEEDKSNLYVFLENNTDEEKYDWLAQLFSLDIRGDYGFFLNKKDFEKEIVWSGNLFYVKVQHDKVKIIDLTQGNEEEEDREEGEERKDQEETKEYILDYPDWENALEEWKKAYLEHLGFRAFDLQTLNHVFGILIIANDLIGNIEECKNSYKEIFIEALKRSADRFGIKRKTIYKDCIYMLKVDVVADFYSWGYSIISGVKYEDNMDNPVWKTLREKSLVEEMRKNIKIYLGVEV